MYEQVFSFNARPFTSTPYVNHYFGASAMHQAFGQASICIQRGSGPVIAIGDIGTGKSLLLAKLAAEYQAAFQVVDIDCSRVNNRKDFLQNILFQLGKPFTMDSETELRFAVIECANPTEASPNGLLILADDAETLTADIFDEMRQLTNIVVDGSPQVRLVLAGRQSLEDRLNDPALASFSQRIASRVFLTNLSRDETSGYVVEHINRVGGDGQGMFPAQTIARLHELTDGCPRLINQVCDFVLILAGTRGTTTVSASLIEEAWNDVQSLPMGSRSIAATDSSATAKTNAASEWTLIEFGQLEDDLPAPAEATVYDFKNSSAPTESVASETPQQEAPETPQQEAPETTPESAAISQLESVPGAQVDLAAAALASTTGVDPELGIDLGSLQAMQSAAATQSSAESSNDTAPVPDSQTAQPTAETEANQADSDARVAMEQQLAAVFGNQQPNAVPEATASAATEPSSDTNIPEVGQPTESNSIAGILSASAVAASVASGASQLLTPETPPSEGTFQPATQASANPTAELPVSETPQALGSSIAEPPTDMPTSSNVPDPSDGFTPAFPADQFTPATQPIEGGSESPVTEPPAEPATTAPLAQDPFGESFAVETKIPDSVASETISQNQNALKLTSADLSQLTPLNDPSPDSIVQPAQADTVPETPETDMPAGVSWLESSIATQAGERAIPKAEPPVENSEPEPVVNEAPAVPSTTPAQRGFSILPMGTPESVEPVATEQAVPETADAPVPVDPQIANEAPNVAETATELRKPHNDESVSDEISRKADEILARLRNNADVTPVETQEEQILSNIQEQQREVNDSQLLGESEQQSVSMPEPNPHRGDSDMLIVNPDTGSLKAKPTPETFPMTDSPISSGRATRMDYEQLFDRLRNQPDENQQQQ